MTNDLNKRRFSRLSFASDAVLQLATRGFPAHLIDISIKGALVEHPPGWDAHPQDKGLLTIRLADSDITINMQIEVAHVEPETIGLRCLSIDVDSMTHLRRLMELNLGDPNLVERELGMLG